MENTWINEFSDKIFVESMGLRATGIKHLDANVKIIYDGKYLKTVGSVGFAKGVVNKLRQTKCKWIGAWE